MNLASSMLNQELLGEGNVVEKIPLKLTQPQVEYWCVHILCGKKNPKMHEKNIVEVA